MHLANNDFGSSPLIASLSNRFSISDQASLPTLLVMNRRPFKARLAPDLVRSILLKLLEEATEGPVNGPLKPTLLELPMLSVSEHESVVVFGGELEVVQLKEKNGKGYEV
uniref:Uncharacterized protein n=1 Tax=Cucumis melo TaxID=3656 RepID=A0A9I9E650_CUCME